jgi:CubicO group peptidase (beta-lactamase class C family)
MSTADAYVRFAMMLANRGELNGVRILAPRSIELMGSAYIPDTLPGRPSGEGYGLSVRVVTDPVARRTTLSKGSFGWTGAYGTHSGPTRRRTSPGSCWYRRRAISCARISRMR